MARPRPRMTPISTSLHQGYPGDVEASRRGAGQSLDGRPPWRKLRPIRATLLDTAMRLA